MHLLKATMVFALSAFALDLYGQAGVRTPLAATAATPVPALVPYAAVALGADGKPLSGDRAVTFLIYKDERGSDPLWVETQTVAFDATGNYQAQLGATSPNGIPLEVFSSGEARWLEVQIAGEQPAPRIQILSVPYALKSADASTLGGLPSSAFVHADAESVAGSGASTAAEATATKGRVTSVKLSAPSSDFHVSGSPVTKAGTLALHWNDAPTSKNTANTIVKRDANGGFAAGSITANAQLIGLNGPQAGIVGNVDQNDEAGVGVTGQSATGIGVYGNATGASIGATGVVGYSEYYAGVIGTNNGVGGVGVYGTGSTGVLGIGSELGFLANGDAQQARTAAGWVKALLYVDANGNIDRCFNSSLAHGENTLPCGLSIAKVAIGDYYVNFNFEVDDRFYLGRLMTTGEVFVSPIAPQTLRIQLVADGSGIDAHFNLIVF